MIFHQTPLQGALVIEAEQAVDERGFFSRTYCSEEFSANGVEPNVAQISISANLVRGTLRGLHFQAAPHEEAKTVRCIQGAVFDVIVDLRRGSITFGRWFGLELRSGSTMALHAPKGFAHGFVTLEDDTVVQYIISTGYVASDARGIRYDDPTLAIAWPIAPLVVSPRDLALPSLTAVFGE